MVFNDLGMRFTEPCTVQIEETEYIFENIESYDYRYLESVGVLWLVYSERIKTCNFFNILYN